jgi:hypothetical protein
MKRAHVEAVETGVAAQAGVTAPQIAHKVGFRELAFVRKVGVGLFPIFSADFIGEVFDCCLRGRRGTQQIGS